eukprot:EG_transcript_33654
MKAAAPVEEFRDLTLELHKWQQEKPTGEESTDSAQPVEWASPRQAKSQGDLKKQRRAYSHSPQCQSPTPKGAARPSWASGGPGPVVGPAEAPDSAAFLRVSLPGVAEERRAPKCQGRRATRSGLPRSDSMDFSTDDLLARGALGRRLSRSKTVPDRMPLRLTTSCGQALTPGSAMAAAWGKSDLV